MKLSECDRKLAWSAVSALIFVFTCIIFAEVTSADDTAPFPLWKVEKPLPNSKSLLPIRGIQFHVIKRHEPDTDGFDWLHGVALAEHRGKLFASFGHNTGAENTAGEVTNGCLSEDGGKTWGAVFPIDQRAQPNGAVSHGVFVSTGGTLWAFHGAFENRLQNVCTRASVLDESASRWRSKGVVIREGFWPMQPPLKMTNGNWIMAGLVIQNGFGGVDDPGAVAISHGDDMTRWDMIAIPKRPSMNMWGETCVIVDGANVLAISRYRLPIALVATSSDYGKTWTTFRETNLPMAASQPFAGVLSTGERFLIGSISSDNGNRRSPLAIAISRPGSRSFSRIYRIRDAICDGPGESGPNVALSYPYALERDGNLLVGYSNDGGRGRNRNSAELAIIPISSLQHRDAD